jgi:hypothetical protein
MELRSIGINGPKGYLCQDLITFVFEFGLLLDQLSFRGAGRLMKYLILLYLLLVKFGLLPICFSLLMIIA